ncbi:MAG: hypothetical protein HY319_15390 [Armatimonadetes bacterium]|nr:hypothetical protein [Armatimonadota bacterium]
MTSRELFLGLVIGLAIQRLAELRLSRAHERRLLAKGAYEVGAEHFPWMRALHIGWFAAMLVEVYWGGAAPQPLAVAAGLVGLLAGQALRYAAILSLGSRWTVRVLVLPGEPQVTSGIYRYLRHPNYLGVCLELASVPLLHGAYGSALLFSGLNLLILRRRIQVEEAALAAAGSARP